MKRVLVLTAVLILAVAALLASPCRCDAAGAPRLGPAAVKAGPIYGRVLERYIVLECLKLRLDAAAVLSIACVEGGFNGAVGPGGCYGPWQLIRGGALPACVLRPQTWANSRNGVKYVLRAIARVARHRRGLAAVTAIAYRFERPASPAYEVSKAWRYYPAMRRLARVLSR